jgi:hypothetical protein
MNSNSLVLNAVEQVIAELETQFARLDQLETELAGARQATAVLTMDHDRVVQNTEALSPKTRVAQFMSTGAAVELARGDLRRIQNDITKAKATVVATGNSVRARCAEIVQLLVIFRRDQTRAQLAALLDFTRIGAAADGLENTARSILALRDVEYYFTGLWVGYELDSQLALLRQLPGWFAQLRREVESEPDFVLPDAAATVAVAA